MMSSHFYKSFMSKTPMRFAQHLSKSLCLTNCPPKIMHLLYLFCKHLIFFDNDFILLQSKCNQCMYSIDCYPFVMNLLIYSLFKHLLIVTLYLNNYIMSIIGAKTSVTRQRACNAVSQVANRPASFCILLGVSSFSSLVVSRLASVMTPCPESETF